MRKSWQDLTQLFACLLRAQVSLFFCLARPMVAIPLLVGMGLRINEGVIAMARPKLLVFGSLNVDFVYQVPHFVQPGETLLSTGRQVFAGGKGLNQAVALAQAGGEVYFDGAVGADDGTILLKVLDDKHIDTTFVKKRTDNPSGHTFIQVDSNGQNCILLYGGANQSHSKEEIDACLESFSAGDYLVVQNETNDVAYMIERAAKRGLKVCINASPLDAKVLAMPLELCSYIIVNEIEGAALVGDSSIDADSDPYVMIAKLKAKFDQSTIVLTLGSKGSLLTVPGSEQIFACKAFKVQAVDTTAAGDTFLGYLIEQLSEGMEPQVALQRATAASALAVTREGATPSIPAIAEVLEFLQTHEPTLVERL